MGKKLIGGILKNNTEVVNAIQDLEHNGYMKKDISAVIKDEAAASSLEASTGIRVSGDADQSSSGKDGCKSISGGVLPLLGVPKERADAYEKWVEQDKVILLVNADENQHEQVCKTITTHTTGSSCILPALQ